MSRVNDKVSRDLEVPLRAFCWKARGGGGRLRHATMVGILFIIYGSYIL